ncbi:histidine phosphatase superfamily [Melanogaster broomeanus]|nr:histidine phosphatase superfamily [Melanogaster broomeanus]
MLTISFIRHGESLDNLKSVWAGHKDAELSELATALGESYADTRLTAIVTSDLKRAHATATALFNGQPNPKPSFKVDRDIREQNFGDAEGISWLMSRVPNKSLEDHFKDGQYPVPHHRNEKFPNGESLNDLAARADRAIHGLVLKPYLALSVTENVHVAMVSHGLCISELIPALLKRNHGGGSAKDYRGLMNTAWTRVTVQAKPNTEISADLDNLPPLVVTVTDVNRHEHINKVKRQKGIVEHDPKQKDIREFFGGGEVKGPVEALEHVESNAMDEVEVEELN